jgi:hypothetical protein
MDKKDPLADSLRDLMELERFLHPFIGALAQRHLKPGEEVAHLAKELGLELPAAFKGAPITWVGREEASAPPESQQTLMLLGPGMPEALGLTIGCIRVRGRKFCLECGFWYCRIVIKF